jgi:hypothetical protein
MPEEAAKILRERVNELTDYLWEQIAFAEHFSGKRHCLEFDGPTVRVVPAKRASAKVRPRPAD